MRPVGKCQQAHALGSPSRAPPQVRVWEPEACLDLVEVNPTMAVLIQAGRGLRGDLASQRMDSRPEVSMKPEALRIDDATAVRR